MKGSHTYPVLLCHPCRKGRERQKPESEEDEHHGEGDQGDEEGEAGGGDGGGEDGHKLATRRTSWNIFHPGQSVSTFNASSAHYVFGRKVTHLGNLPGSH